MYVQHPLHPAGYRQVQLTEFVSDITPPLNAVRVTIQPVGQDIRFRDDSIDPSTTLGIHVAKDSTYVLDSDTTSLRLVSEASTNAAEPAVATLASGPANSDVTFESVDTGPEWNAYDFEIVEDAVVGVNSTATLNSAAVNSDIVFTADTQDPARDGVTFTTVLDATVGANATATLASAAVNSDLTFTAVEIEDQWNGYNFTTVADANAGANATATLDINAANGDMTFTAPTKDDAHNGTVFVTNADVATSITYDPNTSTFTINYDDNVATANNIKAAFDAAKALNPTWPQWTGVVEGDGTGVWATVDDGATDTAAGGVDTVDPSIVYTGPNTFTIHILPTTIGSEVVTLWSAPGAPANCANFAIADEGDGSGVVDANTAASAGGIDVLAPYINFAANTFTIHAYSGAIASDIVALWAAGPAECANWAIADEGAGGGVIQAKTDASAGGAIPVATSIDFAANTFTIHTYPAVTTGADVVVLWAAGPAECADWTCTDEGDGTGVVAASTDTSANGADAVGAVVNLLWHKEI